MPIECKTEEFTDLTRQHNNPSSGYVELFKLHNRTAPDIISCSDSQYPLSVAADVIFDPDGVSNVNGVNFHTVHVQPRRHPKSNKPIGNELMIPPVFGVSVSETVRQHPERQKATQLIENLQTMSSPWIGIESVSRTILEE